MTYCPLDDTDSNKYADGSAAKLDGMTVAEIRSFLKTGKK